MQAQVLAPLRRAHPHNPIHIVPGADVRPEPAMTSFKACASRALNAHAHRDRLRWTRHGSTKYLWSSDSMDAAVTYVLDKQGERMAWHEAPVRVRSLTVAAQRAGGRASHQARTASAESSGTFSDSPGNPSSCPGPRASSRPCSHTAPGSAAAGQTCLRRC